MSMSTHLANRVRHLLADRNDWPRFPDDVREWLEVQSERSVLPEPHQLLVETFPHEGRHYMVAYSFEGWNAHQSLGMLITKRMENAGLKPLGFVANDYALACYGLEPITDPEGAVLAPTSSSRSSSTGSRARYLLKTRLPRGRGDRRAGRAPPSRASEDRAAGQLLDRPHLRRAAPLRAASICCCAPPGTTRGGG